MPQLDSTSLCRFMAKVSPEPNSGCWLWTGAAHPNGYGSFNLASRLTDKAHRISYEHFVGDIPDGLEIDHKCRVRCCVNPAHLEPVTHLVNMKRGVLGRRTHCPSGHPLEGDNLIIRENGTSRRCRKCKQARELDIHRRYRARKGTRVRFPKAQDSA